MSKTEKFIDQIETFSARNYAPIPVVIERAEGVYLYDVEGKQYIDMLSAYSAVNQGHQHPRIVEAMIKQIKTLALTSRAFHNDQMGPYLEKLCGIAGFDQALPMNSGAEGVETALKLARRWSTWVKKVPDHESEILVANDNFHGRTITIVGFSSDDDSRDGFGPKTPGFRNVRYGDAEALEAAITDKTAAFMVEPIQGEAGVIIPPAGYLKRCQEICRKHNVLFICDEIQTGLGRTGTMFRFQAEDAKPDVLILGKALSGGLYPVSAVLASKDVMSVFTPGSHGSTYGGNPLACAVASAALDVILDEDLAGRAKVMGERFVKALSPLTDLPKVKELRGAGLMVALEFHDGIAKKYVKALAKAGVLAKDTHETTIRFAPPLVISEAQIDKACQLILEVIGAESAVLK